MNHLLGMCIFGCLALVMTGCGGRSLSVERFIEPSAEPSPLTDSSMGVTGDDLAKAQFIPLLQRYGLAVDDEASPRWSLEILSIQQAAEPQRVLHEYEVQDGGPMRRERVYYQVKPWVVSLQLRDGFEADSEPQQFTGIAIEDPAPDQRHEQGVWILGSRTVQSIRGSSAGVEQAAMDNAAQQLRDFFRLLTEGERVEITFDTQDMSPKVQPQLCALAPTVSTNRPLRCCSIA